MPAFATLNDILSHALFRAGEITETILSDGDFYNTSDGGAVLRYVNDTLEGLLLGSPLGLTGENGEPLPAVDWWWARKTPPATLFLLPPVTSGLVTATQGAKAITFDSLVGSNPAIIGQFIVGQGLVGALQVFDGFRIRIGDSRYLPRIVSTDVTGTTTVCQLDDFWPDDSQTSSYVAFPLEYTLPSDFLRFTGQPTLSGDPWRFDVMDADTLDQAFPISSVQGGRPQAAALIAPQTIRLSHYSTVYDRVEIPSYIYEPDKFTLATTNLILPPHYRRILALGAAYYILYDKADTKAGDIMGEFKGMYRAMVNEHMRHQRKMSKGFGTIKYRLGQVRGLPGQGPLRTSSGLIIAP